jgi:hypothetical protein
LYLQDLSGMLHLSCNLSIPTEKVGTYDTYVPSIFLLIVRSGN